jgi:predicted anti-sigma-YlaC factor YlaD
MNCHDLNSKLADLLLEPGNAGEQAKVHKDAQAHLASCAACRRELDELRATMALLDTWQAPEPNPYFMTRLNARLAEERQAAPAGWLERMRARFTYSSRLTLRPVAAMVMTVALLVGGGTYLGLNNWNQPAVPPETAVVHDLQTLDNNAQLLDQLESLSDQADDDGGGS